MRKILFLLIFFNIHFASFNQVIRGTVLEKETDSVVMFASIYFAGSQTGTTSDENGKFELKIPSNIKMPLTISAIGYYSLTLKDFDVDKEFIVNLTPKVFDLEEVVVESKSLVKKRKRNLRLFKQEFLGKSSFAKKCEIINEEDIKFDYTTDNDTLIAFALKPIIIHNKALAYKITYYLDQFEYYKKDSSFIFKGSIRFTDNLLIDNTEKKLIERKRRKAYLGSRMHFFRSLWINNLAKAGFSVTSYENKQLLYKDLVFTDVNNKFLKQFFSLKISYFREVSYLNLSKKLIYFDRNGYVDQSGVFWMEGMAKQRIADLLPYEYQLTINEY